MKTIIIFCLFAVSTIVAEDQCRWRKNYIYYSISGENSVNGISPELAVNCVRRAFHLFENSMIGYYFVSIDSAIFEEIDLEIRFIKSNDNKKPASTKINCTDDYEEAGNIIQTIGSGKILINSDYNFTCSVRSTNNDTTGVNLFTTMLREIGHAVGMHDNEDATSIVYKETDNFEYFTDNGALNAEDVKRLHKIYIF